MSLQLILGSSGSGKSRYLYEKLIQESIAHPKENFILIVPEQFSMQTQKDIVALHPKHGVMNIDIVSFGRLSYRVFSEVGAMQLPVLDDTGKNLLLRKVLENKKEELKLYGNKRHTPGMVSEIKSVVSEFYQYGIRQEEQEKMLSCAKKKPMLHAKLSDIQVIIQEFERFMAEHYITKEEQLDVLCHVINESKKVKESSIWMDGFTGFTPIQYQLIGLLLTLSPKVTLTVTIDARENPYHIGGEQELFHMSKEMISHMVHLTEERQVKKEKDIVLSGEEHHRFEQAEPLFWLERNLFRYPYTPYTKKQDVISIHVAGNPAKEAASVAREIVSLVREKGYRYRDIAIIAGDLELYRDGLEEALSENQLPYFVDQKKGLMGNPCVEFIRSTLEMIADNFSYESVFRYLKSNMTSIAREDVDLLENYCLAMGIRGQRQWEKLWVRSMKKDEPLELEKMNQLREAVLAPIQNLASTWKRKKGTVQEKMEALYRFLQEIQLQEKMEAYEKSFREQGNLAKEKEYKQVYPLVMELFDKVVGLLGEEQISAQELNGILDAGFEELKVGLIPPSIDQILIGDMERTRLNGIRALFFLGLNDGIIPKNNGKGGLLSQMERQFLKEEQITLSPTQKENAYIQKFYLYLNLTKPSERLYLSYSRNTQEGEAIRPSYLVYTMEKLFPELVQVDEDQIEDSIRQITTPEGTLHYWISKLLEFGQNPVLDTADPVFLELTSWYLGQSDWKEKTERLFEAISYHNEESGIGKLAAAALYGPQPINSVTRLERYAACAFAHFLTYGLRLAKRQEFEMAAVDMGNLFHNTIERYSNKVKENGLKWSAVTSEEQEKMVKECVEEASADYKNHVLQSTARNAYFIDRLERIVNRTVWALKKQLQKGKFEPVNYEVTFSVADELNALTIPISDQEKMRLVGRLDRMDRYEDDEQIYIKVIDYKSGVTQFDLSSVYYGLQIQLVVYMEAVMETERRKRVEKTVIPAGIFYYNIQDPVIEETDEMGEEQVEKELLSRLRMNGLVNSASEVIALLDSSMDKRSDVIPISYNKDGSLTKNSSAVNTRQFDAVSTYVRNMIRRMGVEILNGNTQIAPYRKGSETGCDYCEFREVCGFDEKSAGYEYRKLQEMDSVELLQRMETEMTEMDGKEKMEEMKEIEWKKTELEEGTRQEKGEKEEEEKEWE